MAKEATENSIQLDTTDLEGMCALMDEYGDSLSAFYGENQEGEEMRISIGHETIVTETYQSNGWLRKNIYYRDGTSEELFPERWREPRPNIRS